MIFCASLANTAWVHKTCTLHELLCIVLDLCCACVKSFLRIHCLELIINVSIKTKNPQHTHTHTHSSGFTCRRTWRWRQFDCTRCQSQTNKWLFNGIAINISHKHADPICMYVTHIFSRLSNKKQDDARAYTHEL